METRTRERLDLIGVTLALTAGGLHLVWGLPRLLIYAQVGRMPDVRPPLFIIGFCLVIVGAVMVLTESRSRYGRYLLTAVMIGYLLGYLVWHMTGHPTIGPGFSIVTSEVHTPVTVVSDHLRSDRFAFATNGVEVLALAILLAVIATTQNQS